MMDEREFEQRARACRERLFRICYAFLPDRADRDDAIQEALIKAWRKRDTLKDDALFEGWLIRIAVNECKNILRRRKRRPEAELAETLPAEDLFPNFELRDALRHMDIRLRIPVVLHYIEGYTVRETAHLLHIPLGTAKHRLSQAKAILQTQLKEE